MAEKLVPVWVGDDQQLTRYIREIRRFPLLEPEEEYMLAQRYQLHNDIKAAHKLVTSHLRLVAKIAMGYRGYGLPMGEVISEGNIGLMQAVKKFDPEKGFRLATYAIWWIKASIQDYVLRSWSLVKIGTTAARKRLFFKLRQMKSKISALDSGDLLPHQVQHIAEELGVQEEEVVSMNRRLSGDVSLNVTVRSETDSGEWQDWLVDENPNQEVSLVQKEETQLRQALLQAAFEKLTPREQHILRARRLTETPVTLEALSGVYGISRERVRQIEVQAFKKLKIELCQDKHSSAVLLDRSDSSAVPGEGRRNTWQGLPSPESKLHTS